MNWNSIIEGGAAGIVAAVLLSIFALSRNIISDFIFKWRFKKSLRWLEVGSGISGITVGIKNNVGRVFRVRSVALLADEICFKFNASGEVKTCCDQLSTKLTRKQKKMLKSGAIDKIAIRSELAHEYRMKNLPPDGFVAIEPYTSHSFILPASYAAGIPKPIKGVEVVIEYLGAGNDAKILRLILSGSNDLISGSISMLAQEIESGTFDAARAKFGMPPVRQMMKPEEGDKNAIAD